jgi:hypothetical protein
MRRLRALLGETELHIFLFFLCIFLFGWPFVSFSDVARLEIVFIYLFIIWSAVIFLLYLVGRSQTEKDKLEANRFESR